MTSKEGLRIRHTRRNARHGSPWFSSAEKPVNAAAEEPILEPVEELFVQAIDTLSDFDGTTKEILVAIRANPLLARLLENIDNKRLGKAIDAVSALPLLHSSLSKTDSDRVENVIRQAHHRLVREHPFLSKSSVFGRDRVLINVFDWIRAYFQRVDLLSCTTVEQMTKLGFVITCEQPKSDGRL